MTQPSKDGISMRTADPLGWILARAGSQAHLIATLQSRTPVSQDARR